jgi:hypothetical protein
MSDDSSETAFKFSQAVLKHDSGLAYALLEDAYNKFAATHKSPTDRKAFIDPYVRFIGKQGQFEDREKATWDEKILPNMAAAFGLEQLGTKPLGAHLSSADLGALRADSNNPLNQWLADELIRDADRFKLENPNTKKTTDGIGAEDLSHHRNQDAPTGIASQVLSELLDGDDQSVFSAVARQTHLLDNPTGVALSRHDFEKFYASSQDLLKTNPDPTLQHQHDVVWQVLQNWDEVSGKLLTDDNNAISKNFVYRAADVLVKPAIFNAIARESAHPQGISGDDIRRFVHNHKGDSTLTEDQHRVLGMLDEVARRLQTCPQDPMLSLLGNLNRDNSGGTIYFTPESIKRGILQYLLPQEKPPLPKEHGA